MCLSSISPITKRAALEGAMRPRKHETTGEGDLFRARLDQIINMEHELVELAGRLDWSTSTNRSSALQRQGRPGLRRGMTVRAQRESQKMKLQNSGSSNPKTLQSQKPPAAQKTTLSKPLSCCSRATIDSFLSNTSRMAVTFGWPHGGKNPAAPLRRGVA